MTDYSPVLLEQARAILAANPDSDFYIFRNPECTIPPLTRPNAIHRINDAVKPGRFFLVDKHDLTPEWSV